MDAIDVYQRLDEGDHVRLTIQRAYENHTLEGDVDVVEVDDTGVSRHIEVDLRSVYRRGASRYHRVELEPEPGSHHPLECRRRDTILGGVHSLSSDDVGGL